MSAVMPAEGEPASASSSSHPVIAANQRPPGLGAGLNVDDRARIDLGLVLVGEGPHEDRQDRWQVPVVTAWAAHRLPDLLLMDPALRQVASQPEPPGHLAPAWMTLAGSPQALLLYLSGRQPTAAGQS
jgi:hypothetical protein